MPELQPMIWARLTEQGRGPARTLDRRRIVEAAIAIADSEGLEAVSMRRIGAQLNHSAMSLYRHVGNKTDLFELMYDEVLGELDLSGEGGGWRTRLTELTRGYRRLHLRHPWIIGLGYRPTFGPNFRNVMEYALACVGDLGLPIGRMVDLALTPLQFARGFVQEELAEVEDQRRTGLDEAAWRRHTAPAILELIDSGDYPTLRRVLTETDTPPDSDATFEDRLTMIMDGMAAALSPHE
ncbi:TetR family transcriptional regulator [Nocardia tenerifensis]|uniref:TetR family transcriptional regulator n=1 Tax=Nocardia tenerifensis TaxID=228006 RepID=A0A318K9G4_9NOCA|nr:TetR/AcrR family transcriptional regulator [Nocardia tenerifensis]PXX69364.1 TetR family transcriptional regulator [Nocardia tenerifensis]